RRHSRRSSDSSPDGNDTSTERSPPTLTADDSIAAGKIATEGTEMRPLSALAAAGGIGAALLTAAMPAAATGPAPATASQHVLLLSVDGMHQSDLRWWVRQHPLGNLAALVRGGVEYTRASTPVPSDSFPGMVAQVTGGDPRTTGVYYDDSYNRA